MSKTIGLMFLGSIGLWPSPVAASSVREQQKEVPRFEKEVRAIAIQVFVTDKGGKAVGGLTADDFQVKDEKKDRPILALYEVDAAAPALDAAGPVTRATARRQFLLLFDLSFSNPMGLLRSRDAARAFVQSLEPSDLASVATFSVQTGPETLVGFTTDRRQLESAIATLGLTDHRRVHDPLDLATNLDDFPRPQSEGRLEERINNSFRSIAGSLYWQQVDVFIDSLTYLGRILDSVQGRKQIVLLSGGFYEPTSVGRQLSKTNMDNTGRVGYYDSLTQFGDSDKLNDIDEMIESLTASDTIVHTVDVNGLESDLDAHFQGRVYQSGRESLRQIAQGTGGTIIKDTNDPAGELGKILDMSRRYYVLAFEPTEFKEPGRFHDLKVRLDKKGMNVSHRRGYREPDPEMEKHPHIRQVRAAEVLVKGLTGGPIELHAIAVPYRDDESRVTLPVMLEVDGGTLLDRQGASVIRLEMFGYLFDDLGRVIDFVHVTPSIDLRLFTGMIRERGVQLHTSFRARTGRFSMGFLVRDHETGRTGTMRVEVDVPDFVPGRIVLYPPLFMDHPGQWVILQERSRLEPHQTIPFRVAEEAFTPRGAPTITNGQADRICVMFSDGGAQYDEGASFGVSAQLYTTDGQKVHLGPFKLDKAVQETDGFRRFVLSFTPQHLTSGEYELVVNLKDPSTGRTTVSRQKVMVE